GECFRLRDTRVTNEMMTCHGRCFLYEDFLLLEYRKIKRPFPLAACTHPIPCPLVPFPLVLGSARTPRAARSGRAPARAYLPCLASKLPCQPRNPGGKLKPPQNGH